MSVCVCEFVCMCVCACAYVCVCARARVLATLSALNLRLINLLGTTKDDLPGCMQQQAQDQLPQSTSVCGAANDRSDFGFALLRPRR